MKFKSTVPFGVPLACDNHGSVANSTLGSELGSEEMRWAACADFSQISACDTVKELSQGAPVPSPVG